MDLRKKALEALDELLDSDELEDGEWLKVNMLYHQLESVLDDDNMEELED